MRIRGNWITLDFRGLIFGTYVALLAIHVTVSSIVVLLLPESGVLRIHFGSILISVILLVTGVVVYGKLAGQIQKVSAQLTTRRVRETGGLEVSKASPQMVVDNP